MTLSCLMQSVPRTNTITRTEECVMPYTIFALLVDAAAADHTHILFNFQKVQSSQMFHNSAKTTVISFKLQEIHILAATSSNLLSSKQASAFFGLWVNVITA